MVEPAAEGGNELVEHSATLTSTGTIKSITDTESSLPPLRGMDANIDKYMAHHGLGKFSTNTKLSSLYGTFQSYFIQKVVYNLHVL